MDFIPYISFLTGIVSIISPCIIPVLPILFGFTLENKTNNELISFTLGLFSIFMVLIFLTGIFTVVVYSYIFYIRIISSLILLAIGIQFISNKTFNLSFKYNSNLTPFLLGVLTSLSWSPCYGGYLISLLSILLTTGNMAYIILNIILYSTGFGFALLVLSYILSKINIERLTKNSLIIKRASGFLFIFAAIHMFLAANGILFV